MYLKLDDQIVFDEFFSDAKIIGVVAPMRDYYFCWRLNNDLFFDFRINNEIEIEFKRKGRSYFFSIYHFEDRHLDLSHYIYNNHFDGEFLLPELRHFDFIWLIKGDSVSVEYLNNMLTMVKNIQVVQLITEVNLINVKNKANLLF